MDNSHGTAEWLERVIPRPKQITVGESVQLDSEQISLELPAESYPEWATIRGLLAPLAMGGDGAMFALRFALAAAPNACSDETRAALEQCANAEQAYAIEPLRDTRNRFCGLLLVAHEPAGLLFAARTLRQLVALPADGAARVEVPSVQILDWPDIAERGQWGGNVRDDVAWTSQWKLNLVEVLVDPYLDEAGQPRIRMDQAYVDERLPYGAKVVPYLSHLGQIALRAGLIGRPELTGTPDPSKPLPSEYVPGLCTSSPATVELARAWLAEMAQLEGVEDVEVWLSEDRAPCFCDRCRGEEPFVLEVRCIARAFEQVRQTKPSLRLWFLLSQGSYAVNDQVLAAVPQDAGVTYYDGGRTYDSSHAPMIVPLLEAYSRSGRRLGVYPQLTHSWRTVFPWTAPQFIHARAAEFAEKGLRRVTGYAVPDNRHHEYNVAAWGEWTWNSGGRSPAEFSRAYARARGIADPALYAEWAVKAGDAGWWLAESRLFLRAIYDPRIALRSMVPSDFRFEKSDLLYERPQIEAALEGAEQALELAYRLCERDPSAGQDAVDESEALCAGLRALLAIDVARPILNDPALDATALDAAAIDALAAAARELDHAAAIVSTRVAAWGARVVPAYAEDDAFRGISRLRDTANVLLRVSDAVRERATELGVADPYPEHRLLPVGAWSADDFVEGRAGLSLDLTPYVSGPGTWFVGFDYLGGDLGAIVERVSVSLHEASSSRTVLAETVDGPVYVGRWERWHEIKVIVPETGAVDAITLTVELAPRRLGETLPDRWACNGQVGIRQGWPLT